MIFTSLLSAAVCVSSALAQAPKYSFLSVHSGDPRVHLEQIGYNSSGTIQLYAENALETELIDSELQQVNSSLYVSTKPNGQLILGPTGQGGYDVAESQLTLQNQADFVVCPSLDYTIYATSDAVCNDAVGIVVYATQDQ